MKIVNKQQFYALPAGTLFSFYDPCVFEGLAIKGETIEGDEGPIDFWYRDLIGNVYPTATNEMFKALDEAQANGTDLELTFDANQRDALYDKNALYAVYSQQDLTALSAILETCVGV